MPVYLLLRRSPENLLDTHHFRIRVEMHRRALEWIVLCRVSKIHLPEKEVEIEVIVIAIKGPDAISFIESYLSHP